MVRRQLSHPGGQVPAAPVAGQREGAAVGAHPLQTDQVGTQGVRHGRPGGDIGGNIEEHVIPKENGIVFLQEEAHLPRRVSRHQQAPQPPGAQLQKLAVLQAFIVTAGGRRSAIPQKTRRASGSSREGRSTRLT